MLTVKASRHDLRQTGPAEEVVKQYALCSRPDMKAGSHALKRAHHEDTRRGIVPGAFRLIPSPARFAALR